MAFSRGLSRANRFVSLLLSHSDVSVSPGTHLLPVDVILFAPVERDLSQRLRSECKPSRLDAVPPKHELEMPKCTCAVDGVHKILANPVGLHRSREVLHDRPLVN